MLPVTQLADRGPKSLHFAWLLERPELNELAFRPDPEGRDKRIYLTGDLGQMSSDGCVTHLGWKNLQVNIRGYRVETAEIETQLLRHPDLKEVAVYGRQNFSGETHLIAALVPFDGTSIGTHTLRQFLKDCLPEYMHPSVYLLLNRLPYGPNGKLDRRALPTPDWLEAQGSANFVAARSEMELMIVDIWSEALGILIGVKIISSTSAAILCASARSSPN